MGRGEFLEFLEVDRSVNRVQLNQSTDISLLSQSIDRHVSIFQLAASINPPTKVENERDVLSGIIVISTLSLLDFNSKGGWGVNCVLKSDHILL